MSASFTKLPPIEGSTVCTTCGAGAKSDLSLDSIIAVGFGSAGYSKDGKELWSEQEAVDGIYHTVGDVESIAKSSPDHDWRIYYFGPMWEGEYQRQGNGIWVLVSKGDGFA